MADEVVEDEAVVVAASVDAEAQGAAHNLPPSKVFFTMHISVYSVLFERSTKHVGVALRRSART
jgi:hypothetical protein